MSSATRSRWLRAREECPKGPVTPFLDVLEEWRLDAGLMRLVRAGRWSSWFLVTLGAVLVLTHVCVEPFPVHAVEARVGVITEHGTHDTHDGDDETRHDAAHAASCDAVKAQSSSMLDALVLDAIGGVVSEVTATRSERADAPAIPGSPPLFLLHAALRI